MEKSFAESMLISNILQFQNNIWTLKYRKLQKDRDGNIHLSPLFSKIVDNYKVIVRHLTTTGELDKAQKLLTWRDFQDKNKFLPKKIGKIGGTPNIWCQKTELYMEEQGDLFFFQSMLLSADGLPAITESSLIHCIPNPRIWEHHNHNTLRFLKAKCYHKRPQINFSKCKYFNQLINPVYCHSLTQY